jgi:DNA topoisomerase IB
VTAPLVVDRALDAVATAEAAGLRYVTDDRPGLRRRRAGKGFAYYRPDGALIRDRGPGRPYELGEFDYAGRGYPVADR